MLIKLDENMPTRLVPMLEALGHDVDTALDEGLAGQPDPVVWTVTQAAGRFLVTMDLDFSDVRKFAPGTHHGILVVRLPEDEQWRAADYVAGWLALPESVTWAHCFVVGSPRRLRVRRPFEPGT